MSVEPLTVALPAPAPLRLDESALFLDLDGTLAPIVARPQDVGPDPARNLLLERLEDGLGGRLAVVTGRSLEDADRILGGSVACVAAVHGLVRRDADGAVHATPLHPGLPAAREALARFARADPGLIVEDKGPSIALHYRLAPSRAAAARALARRVSADTGLTLQDGAMVQELRTPGPTKGDSIRAYMQDAPFKGARPVFAGDDVTDEHGFAAVASLGGYGVLVGSPRQTHAGFGLRGVKDVSAWLEAAT